MGCQDVVIPCRPYLSQASATPSLYCFLTPFASCTFLIHQHYKCLPCSLLTSNTSHRVLSGLGLTTAKVKWLALLWTGIVCCTAAPSPLLPKLPGYSASSVGSLKEISAGRGYATITDSPQRECPNPKHGFLLANQIGSNPLPAVLANSPFPQDIFLPD